MSLKINKILTKYKLIPNQTLYVGDEVRDIRAAKEANIGSVAVTWGYESEETLKMEKPNFMAHKPEDLLKLIS